MRRSLLSSFFFLVVFFPQQILNRNPSNRKNCNFGSATLAYLTGFRFNDGVVLRALVYNSVVLHRAVHPGLGKQPRQHIVVLNCEYA